MPGVTLHLFFQMPPLKKNVLVFEGTILPQTAVGINLVFLMVSFVKSLSLVSQDEIKNTLVAEREHLKHTHYMVGRNSPGCSLTELIVLDKSRGNIFL